MQSYSFREFDLEPALKRTRDLGLRYIEFYQKHAPLHSTPEQIQATTSFDGQTELAMRIYQGDSEEAKKNELLGEFVFSGINPGKAGQAQVEVTFDVNV